MRILEAALYVDDLDAAESFYGDTLGLERIVKVDGRHIFFRVGDGVLLLFIAAATREPSEMQGQPFPPHGAEGDGHFCFSATADELGSWAKRLADAGVPIEAEINWPQGGRSIYFRDPAGNSLEFAEPRIWGLQ